MKAKRRTRQKKEILLRDQPTNTAPEPALSPGELKMREYRVRDERYRRWPSEYREAEAVSPNQTEDKAIRGNFDGIPPRPYGLVYKSWKEQHYAFLNQFIRYMELTQPIDEPVDWYFCWSTSRFLKQYLADDYPKKKAVRPSTKFRDEYLAGAVVALARDFRDEGVALDIVARELAARGVQIKRGSILKVATKYRTEAEKLLADEARIHRVEGQPPTNLIMAGWLIESYVEICQHDKDRRERSTLRK